MKTIPKNAGLSHLADVANERAHIVHYPVKKKRQPRQLRPNLEAIRHLETEAEHATTIFEGTIRNNGDDSLDEVTVLRANGWYDAKRADMYPRAMFDLFAMGISSSAQIRYAEPCPACDDWSRTAKCDTHPDEGVEGLKRARRSADTAYRSELALETGLRRAMREMFERTLDHGTSRCTCGLCQTPGVAPLPHIERPAGTVRGRPVNYPEVSQDERLATEWERQNGIPLADALRNLDRTPVDLGPTREDFLRRSITIDYPTIEVNGETPQGVRSITIHVEGGSSDR